MSEEPSYVLIRCPAGHELRALRDDLGKTLACPVCEERFKPTEAAPPSEARPVSPVSPASPASIGYAGHPLGAPPSAPRFTVWLIRLWATFYVVQLANGVMMLVAPEVETIMSGDSWVPRIQVSLTMVIFPMFVAAIVLLLNWIARIHDDARRTLGYGEISPGLAVGLSFIPGFQYPWTAWTMLRLAQAAARLRTDLGSDTSEAVRRAKACLVAGVVLAASYCALGVFTGVMWLDLLEDLMRAGGSGPPDDSAILAMQFSWSFRLAAAGSSLVGFVSLLFYLRAVRAVEGVVYAAPPPRHESVL